MKVNSKFVPAPLLIGSLAFAPVLYAKRIEAAEPPEEELVYF